jgi:uncharacterized repeat protein (TIGR02543 family)
VKKLLIIGTIVSYFILSITLSSCGSGGGGGGGVGTNPNPTYTVTYNGNGNTGGSVQIDTTKYEQGQTVTVLGNTGNLVKTGYSFSAWNTQANGSGTTYTQAQTFTMGAANVTLYATWTASGGVITTHSVTLTWAPNHESGVNSLGGGYQVSISGQPTINVPYTSGSTAPTSTTTTLQTGSYTVTIRAYAALDPQGGSGGSLSALSQSVAVIVP